MSTERPWPENAWPTAEQWLDWLLILDREQQMAQAESRLLDAEHAHRCVLMNHDNMQAEINWLRDRANRIEADQ